MSLAVPHLDYKLLKIKDEPSFICWAGKRAYSFTYTLHRRGLGGSN